MSLDRKQKIKICYVASVDITLRFILLNQLKFLKKQGYDISAVCSSGKWIKDVEKEGIRVKTIELKRKFSPISDLVAFFKLYFYFREEKFQIVHTHTLKPEFFGQIAAKLAGVPIIVNTLHGFDFAEDASYLKKKFFILIEKIAAFCSTLIFSVNKKNIKIVIKEKITTSDKIKYLGNGIDSERFNFRRFSKEFILNKKKELGIDSNKKVIGIVARLVEEKGYLDLFEAFKKVLKTFPESILLVTGPLEPDKKDAIVPDIVKKYNIEKNTIFLGEIAEVDEIYPLMDIFILPSHREGLPYTILEASATSKPVIATNTGGCPEAVDNQVTGVLVPVKKPDKLAQAIINLLNNPIQIKKMGEKGREKVLKEFDEKIIFNRIKAAYQLLINEKLRCNKVCCVVSADMTLKFMLFNQLKFLKKQGYDISAVCSSGKWIKDVEKEGIRVKTIELKRKFSPISDLVAFFKLYFYFREEKFQIVHTHTLKPEFFGQIAAKLAGVPIIVNTLHGFDFAEDASYLKKKFFILIEKIAARFSDKIFSISKEIIKIAIREKTCRVEIIRYLGRDIDIEYFNPARFSKEFILNKKKQLGIEPNKRIIGVVARLVEEKGYLELFQAFRKLLEKFPDTMLLVAGPEEPEKRDAVDPKIVKKYNIENNIMFLGERADVDEIYPLIDIFVLPTHREGLGASILEASAMEKPVIVSNTGGCPEAVDDGKTGILIPLKNVEKLFEAIIYLFNNPEKAKQMGRQGRQKVLKEFDERLIFNRLKAEYQKLIEEKL